jgi:hypothetical protein
MRQKLQKYYKSTTVRERRDGLRQLHHVVQHFCDHGTICASVCEGKLDSVAAFLPQESYLYGRLRNTDG